MYIYIYIRAAIYEKTFCGCMQGSRAHPLLGEGSFIGLAFYEIRARLLASLAYQNSFKQAPSIQRTVEPHRCFRSGGPLLAPSAPSIIGVRGQLNEAAKFCAQCDSTFRSCFIERYSDTRSPTSGGKRIFARGWWVSLFAVCWRMEPTSPTSYTKNSNVPASAQNRIRTFVTRSIGEFSLCSIHYQCQQHVELSGSIAELPPKAEHVPRSVVRHELSFFDRCGAAQGCPMVWALG